MNFGSLTIVMREGKKRVERKVCRKGKGRLT